MTYKLEKASGGKVKQTKYLKKNPLRRYLIQQYLDTVALLARSTDGRTILDVGCGEGFVVRHLHGERPELQPSGVDIDPAVLKVAAYQNPGCLFAVAQATRLPAATAGFDLVLCNEVLEHLDAPEAALREIGRVARRYFIFSVPREPHYRLANMLVGANWSRWGDDEDHRQRWTRGQFVAMLAAHFDVLAVRTPFPWTMALCQKKARNGQ